MTEREIINHYNEQLKASGEKAPEGLWDDIARKMDVNDIWNNIDKELTRKQKAADLRFFFNKVAVIAGFLLLGVVGLWILNNKNLQKDQASGAGSVATAKMHENMKYQGLPQKKEPEEKPPEAVAIKVEKIQDHPAGKDDSAKEVHTKPESVSRPLFAGLHPVRATVVSPSTHFLPQANQKASQIYKNSLDEAFQIIDGPQKSFSFGLTTALKNTWLLNHETFQSLRGISGSRTGLKIYPDIALSMKYAWSTRWDIEAGFSFSSNTGQSYQQYLYGRYDQKDIVLNYFHAEVSALHKSQKRWLVGSYMIGHSTSIGVYLASLNSATETIGDIKEDVANIYRGNDYGILLGHNLEFTLSKRLIFSPGLRLTWGLPNIYTGAYDIPSMKLTRNQSIELRFSLYYNLFN